MTRAHCGICISDLPIDDFRFFPCGHTYCETCTGRLAHGGLIQCPLCRMKLRCNQAIKVRLDIVDVRATLDNIDTLGPSSKPYTVEQAADELKAMTEKPIPEDLAEGIQRAVEEFRDRLAPLFAECSAQRQQIEKLTTQKQHDLHKARLLKHELKKVKHEYEQIKASEDKAISLAEAAKDQVLELRGKAEQAQRDIEAVRAEATDLRIDNARLKSLLDTQRLTLQKKRVQIAEFKERQTELEGKIEAASQVEQSTMDPGTPDGRRRSPCRLPSSPLLPCNQSYEFEGLPQPNFKSTWQIEDPKARKRKLSCVGQEDGGSRPVIGLDGRGRPSSAVAVGPRRGVRVKF
ncbi:hypothetical protein HGRIS_005173 [Hohenbuehelia grisea]|uniref:RING-type domain-containing protein n=1 Tax=Hohenbuehelia grisea TaxID=104357 RepID=A0ABR3JF30_9AGAR